LISQRGNRDAFNPTLAARGTDPVHYFDWAFQPLLNLLAAWRDQFVIVARRAASEMDSSPAGGQKPEPVGASDPLRPASIWKVNCFEGNYGSNL
jgi:hypothetical protein